MDQAKIGRFIARLRREQNLTQEQLGERLRVTGKTVSRWENANYLPDLEMMTLLASVFGVTVEELAAGERRSDGAAEAAASAEAELPRETSFSLREHEDYWKQKWKREHIAAFVTCGIVTLGAFAFAAYLLQSTKILPLIAVAAFVERIVFYNRMMVYVEGKLYDGKTVYPEKAE